MSREVRFTATDAEWAEISAYVAKKKKWHKVGHFLRYAVFTAMEHNRAGRHDRPLGAARAEPPEGIPEVGE